MSASALARLVPGSEETRAVTTVDLLVRGGIKITTASVASGGNLTITCPRDVKLLVNMPLVEVADDEYDMTVLPGGIKGTECFRDSTLLAEAAKQFHRSGHIATAIYAAPATVLVPHDVLLIGDMTGLPTLRDKISAEQWQDKRVAWDARTKLLASQGLSTAIDFGLKTVDLLAGCEKAHEVAS